MERHDEAAMQTCADGMFSIGEACAFSKLSRSELYSQMNAGNLAFVKAGKRRLVPRRALNHFLATQLVSGPPTA